MRKSLIVMFLPLIFIACSVRQENIEGSYPVRLIVKSPNIKLSGLGFYKKGGNYVNLQIFSGSLMVLNYESANSVCINDKCMTRGIFNKQLFLHPHYENLIDDILALKPIYKSKNLERNSSGFSQRLRNSGEYDIVYSVNKNGVEFEDRTSGVFIKLTKMEKQQ